VNAGRLRHKVQIEAFAGQGKDGAGGFIGTYHSPVDAWAEIKPLSGVELVRAQQLVAETTHQITIRYQSALAGLKPSSRVLFGDRTFDVRAVLNTDERNVELVMLAREQV